MPFARKFHLLFSSLIIATGVELRKLMELGLNSNTVT